MPSLSTIRLFYAIEVGSEARDQLEYACSQLRERLTFGSWTHPADYHATVKFIGDVDPRLIGELEEPIQKALVGSKPFELALGSFGSFGKPSAPSVLWCGIDPAGIEPLRLLQGRVEAAAAAIGLSKDDKPFRPHITVARRYRGAELFSPESVNSAMDAEPARWEVKELVLYRTKFGERPAYEALNRFHLGVTR